MMKRQIHTTVGWRKYLDPTDNIRVNKFLNTNGKEVLNKVAVEIDMATSNNESEVMVLVHPNVSSVVVIPEKEYVEVLDHCLTWLTEKEEYESCAQIVKYKDKITSPNKTRQYK